jgi:hypothetical protein
MKNLLLVVAASAALAACQKETVVQGSNEPVASSEAPKVVLPPSITATKTYRCKDNSLVHIDWLSDNLSANFRAEKESTPVRLTAATAGAPLTAEGYSLSGDAKAASITITRPGKDTQSCKA